MSWMCLTSCNLSIEQTIILKCYNPIQIRVQFLDIFCFFIKNYKNFFISTYTLQKKILSCVMANLYFFCNHKKLLLQNYLFLLYIYIYIRLKIKPNSVRIRFLSCQIFVLPSTGFELTPLIHCSTIRLALHPAPQTTRPHPLPIHFMY